MKALLAAVVLFAAGTLLIAYGTDRVNGLGFMCWAWAALALLASAGSITQRIRRKLR